MTSIQPPVSPDPGPLPEGALCYGCCYNLVGRTLEEKCPECGMDIAPSWPVTNEAAAHPVYLKQLRLELIWLNALALMATASNACLAASALMHVFGPGSQARAPASDLLMGIGLAGWFAYVPALMCAVDRVRKHPNCQQMPGAWLRWHTYLGAAVSAIGFVCFLIPVPIALAISQHAGMWAIKVCAFVLLSGALIQLLASWMYAGSILRRARPGTKYVLDTRSLWIPPVAIGAMIAIAVCVWFANDTAIAIVTSAIALATLVLSQRLLRALLAIRRAEKIVRRPATQN